MSDGLARPGQRPTNLVTVGVALAIPQPHAADLQQHRKDFGDPQADLIPPHITLLPPAELPPADIEPLSDRLDEVARRTEPFEVQLSGTGTFRPVSPVVFVALSKGISEAELLEHDLRSAVDSEPAQFPYHPHVTVAHHLDEGSLDHAFDHLADYSCDFTAQEFALYVHDERSGWSPRVSFALSGPDRAAGR